MTLAQQKRVAVFAPGLFRSGVSKSEPREITIHGKTLWEYPVQRCIFCRKPRGLNDWDLWETEEVCPRCAKLAYNNNRFYDPTKFPGGNRRYNTI